MISPFAQCVARELTRARSKHPRRQSSAHEGYAILLEEVDELKAEVWKKQNKRDFDDMLTELVQIGAMAQRMAEDCLLIKAEE